MDALLWFVVAAVALMALSLIGIAHRAGNPNARQDVTFKIKESGAERSIVSVRGSSVASAFSEAFDRLESQARVSQKIETIDKYVSSMEEAVQKMADQYPRFDVSPFQARCKEQRKRLNGMIERKGKYYSSSEAAERRRQRNLITNSLRYEVLKRDGFRCRLCGRGASDGVTLHVDHIVPVSKGGKSVMENLQTLCADCNLGKSDK